MFVSELQLPYLYVPGPKLISDMGMICAECAPELPE